METQPLWETATAVGTTSQVESGFIDTSRYNKVTISRKATGGVYVFEIDWSNDGVTADVTETVTTTNNDQVDQPVANRYAKFRVKNTDGAVAFTNHKTSVVGQIGS